MASLVYSSHGGSFLLYHGDNLNNYIQFEYDKTKHSIPNYENISDYIPPCREYFWCGKDYGINTLEDVDSDCKYRPIIVGGISEFGDISAFFGIKDKEHYEKICREKHIHYIVIKSHLDIWYAMTSNRHVLTFGKPKLVTEKVRWIERFNHPFFNFATNLKYKKFIDISYYTGEDGKHLITIYHPSAFYPNIEFENLSTLDFKPISYSEPSVYTDEQRKAFAEKKKREKEEAERYRLEIEANKEKDGYCDVCGASNASYIANPFDEEMNGICRMQWLCTDCYNNACGDI